MKERNWAKREMPAGWVSLAQRLYRRQICQIYDDFGIVIHDSVIECLVLMECLEMCLLL